MESPEARYTNQIIKARAAVERCIGMLKGRWRCLRKERALHYKPEFAGIKYKILKIQTSVQYIKQINV